MAEAAQEFFEDLRAQKMNGFWDKVKVGKRNECWPWQGQRGTRGYGRYRRNGRYTAAHRIAFLLAYGGFDQTLCVLHRCDNPPCCNPRHLFAGTNKDNVHDMIAKGRTPCIGRADTYRRRGKDYRGPMKLTDDMVRKIRTSSLRGIDLAAKFGVTSAVISLVRQRKKYYWVDDVAARK